MPDNNNAKIEVDYSLKAVATQLAIFKMQAKKEDIILKSNKTI